MDCENNIDNERLKKMAILVRGFKIKRKEQYLLAKKLFDRNLTKSE